MHEKENEINPEEGKECWKSGLSIKTYVTWQQKETGGWVDARVLKSMRKNITEENQIHNFFWKCQHRT